MEQISLYRKYRPSNFDNLVGQDYIKTTLINSVKSGHISHAYLFSGPRGTGKTSTARLIAKALNCKALVDGYDPCNACEFCLEIMDGKLIDIIEIDAASNRGIDEVRDLREKINFSPTRAHCKVYIIDEVHMMTKEAFNALLKTLEEPPAHAFFILATTEIHKIPETIISRCQRFDFKRINHKALMTRLNYIAQLEKIQAEDRALEAISRHVDGSLRDAIGLMEQMTSDGKLTFEHVQAVLGITDLTLLDAFYEALNSGNSISALQIIRDLHDQGSDLKKFAHEFLNDLRIKMLEAVAHGIDEKTQKLIQMIEVFQEAQEKIYIAAIPQLPLEMGVVKISGIPVKKNVSIDIPDETNTVKRSDGTEIPVSVIIQSEERSHKSVSEPLKLDLDMRALKDNWPRIVERIKTPSSRMCLKNAAVFKIQKHDITLQFNTNFDRDKVMEHEHRVEVEKTIGELTGESVRILATVKPIEIKPVIESENSQFDDALNIFGGEVVD